MRLVNGIIIDAEKTLGSLKFSAMRREKMVTDEEGKSTGEVKERTYDLRSRGQGMMIQVSIPAEVAEKKMAAGTPVVLVNPKFDTVVSTTYNNAVVDWYIKAEDIVPAGGASGTAKPVEKNTNEKKESVKQ